jgi:uncharacterized protein YegL
MKKGLTEMVFILDRSGSMSDMVGDTVGGFNSMIEKQKGEEGEALVSAVLFNDRSSVLYDRVPLERIGKMTTRDYTASGCTALIDAIGDAVHHIESVHRYIRKEDVPGNTVFIIMTDGYENASRRWTSDEVKKLIGAKKELGWEFLFLGANIDAVETARHFGIDEDRAVTYRSDKAGTRLNYEVMAECISDVRASR